MFVFYFAAASVVAYFLYTARMKMVIVLNTAVQVSKGELALLASRATVQSYAKSSQASKVSYFIFGQAKITVKADNLDEICQDSESLIN